MSIKDRLIQFVFRGKNDLSPEARKIAADLEKVREKGEALRVELDKAKDAQGLAVALRTTGESADRVQATIDRTQAKVEGLREELERNPDSKGLAVSLREAERDSAKAARELDKLTAQTKLLEAAAKDAGIDTSKLSDEERRLAEEVDRTRQAVSGNTNELRGLERQQRAAARATAEHSSRVDAARQTMATAGKAVLAFAATYISLNAAFNLVRGGINLVRDGIARVISEGSDSEQSLAQLNAALEATGSAAGFSADELLRMADELERNSLFTAEQIVSAQTRLLSYTDVVGEQFPKALQIAIDQAQRLGISVESSAETVGKALQTPSRAMEALGRQGFKLEAGQAELLKRLEATGRMAEAQAIIMDMLTESYGGAAAAARIGTIQGLWKGLTDRMGDFFKMIGNAGALDYIRDRLTDVGNYIQEMADDGRLQRLAESLSSAFIKGAEKVKEFIAQLANADFSKLTDDATAWFNDFGSKIDESITRVQLFFAPFRTLFNGVTSGFAAIGIAGAEFTKRQLELFQLLAAAIPEMFGGEKIRAKLEEAQAGLTEVSAALKAQIERDGADIRNAWDITARHGVESQQSVVDAALEAEQQKVEAAAATAAKVEELNARFKQSALDAAVAGKLAIEDMAQALSLIETAETIEQYEGLREALMKAYQDGKISQEEFANGLNLVREGIVKLGGEAQEGARRIEDIVDSLGSFVDVQKAIKGALTDVDISKLRSAITRLYEQGILSADQYNKALKELAEQQEKLTKVTDQQGGSQTELAKRIELATTALEEQAEAAQKAKDEQEQAAQQSRSIMSDFFGRVLSSVRGSLASLSDAALGAFDSLKQISNADVDFDLDSVQGLEQALDQVNDQLGQFQKNLADSFRQSNPFARFADETGYASAQIKKEFLDQKLQLQQLMDSYARGTTTLSGFASAAGGLRESLDLLDDSDFSQLESAVASARQQMDAMAESTQQTLERMRDELDQLRGDEESLERRRMASRRAELQMRLAEANSTGDKRAIENAQQALGMLTRIESEAAFAREREAREKRGAASSAQLPGQGGDQGSAARQAPSRVIRLEDSRGRGVDLAVADGQEDALLSILEQAGLRTIN